MRTVEVTSAAVASLFRHNEDFCATEGECACRKPIPTSGRLGNRNLSRRQMQLVDLVCQAKLNKEIAHELQLSEGTVKEYLNRLFKKVGARNRTELAILALTQTALAA